MTSKTKNNDVFQKIFYRPLQTFKISNNNEYGRTFTKIGTPHYMAPEMIQGKGYDFAVDLWALGIMMFEFMCGIVPFGEDSEDPFVVYQILSNDVTLRFPGWFAGRQNYYSIKQIEQLLNIMPSVRIGSGFASLKANIF